MSFWRARAVTERAAVEPSRKRSQSSPGEAAPGLAWFLLRFRVRLAFSTRRFYRGVGTRLGEATRSLAWAIHVTLTVTNSILFFLLSCVDTEKLAILTVSRISPRRRAEM